MCAWSGRYPSSVFRGDAVEGLLVKVGEAAHVVGIRIDRRLREIANLHVLRHPFGERAESFLEWGHRSLPSLSQQIVLKMAESRQLSRTTQRWARVRKAQVDLIIL
jgi:hypothetical protein